MEENPSQNESGQPLKRILRRKPASPEGAAAGNAPPLEATPPPPSAMWSLAGNALFGTGISPLGTGISPRSILDIYPPAESSSTMGTGELAKLAKQTTDLRARAAEQAAALQQEKQNTETQRKKLQEYEATISKLQSKERLSFVLPRISPEAHSAVLSNAELIAAFEAPKQCNAFIMSVDLRRSTALMLKARTAHDFAKFLNSLSVELFAIITRKHGVFDKFTGDGVLAFFPDFYTGSDAGYFAIQAALECHVAFNRHYRSSRSSFSSVLTNVGLGIGIDYGAVQLLQIVDGLTVVGVPVVYACRLGGAPAGMTYMNQPAFEEVQRKASQAFLTSEAELDIKHEGPMLAYSVTASGIQHEAARPKWQLAAETKESRNHEREG